MINPYKKNAKLVLSNGIVFPGFFFGASGTAIGEIVFNTGMTGYQEVITDPSYYGQILTFTYPEIGNTGINFEDSESNINVKGIIVRNFSSNNSNWRSKKNFNQWLVEKNIIGLYGIDTRALVKILRSSGAMNGVITSLDKTDDSCLKLIHDTPKMEGLNLSKVVSTKQQYLWRNPTQTTFDLRKRYEEPSKKLKIVAIDFGIKNSILKNYKIDQFENDNIRYMFNNIKQSSNSVSETFYLSKGSTFSKNEIFCDLKGEHSSAFVNGIFSLNKSKHHEIKAKINHFVENTKSYQLVKSVLENKSRSVYQGKIYVDSKAQKTDGYQLSKAILVDETTEFNAKPELEIYADDVKCSHGSASGSLDENSIFYLMSRGLSYKEARELLINGFLVEVINQITDEPIKKLIKNLYGLKNEY